LLPCSEVLLFPFDKIMEVFGDEYETGIGIVIEDSMTQRTERDGVVNGMAEFQGGQGAVVYELEVLFLLGESMHHLYTG